MKITIITATYNSGKTLTDTIESVLRQSYKNIEYILVDGASKDNTLDIVKHYLPLFEGRMCYISEPDRGIYDAMNKGIGMATGEVIGFLNSDDFYTADDVLERVATAMADKRTEAVYGDVHYVHDTDLGKCVRYYSSKSFHRRWMRLGFMPAHPSFYCRREVYEKYGSFDLSYKVAADFEHLLRLIFVNRIRTQYIEMDFVTMRTGGASSSGWVSHKQILLDHVRAYRANHVRSNGVLDSLRYVFKVAEMVKYRIKDKLQKK